MTAKRLCALFGFMAMNAVANGFQGRLRGDPQEHLEELVIFTKAMRIILFIALLFGAAQSQGQPCPPYGSATTAAEKKINTAKNKSAKEPSRMEAQELPLNQLINSVSREDKDRYFAGAYVTTQGHLVSFEEQGPETCNCGEASEKDKDGDVHIYLGLKPDAEKKNCIVIEITPSYKKLHPDYESILQKGTLVKVYGYLFYDTPHRNAAANTCTKCGGVWRKTCWEIHPVTRIEPAQ